MNKGTLEENRREGSGIEEKCADLLNQSFLLQSLGQLKAMEKPDKTTALREPHPRKEEISQVCYQIMPRPRKHTSRSKAKE